MCLIFTILTEGVSNSGNDYNYDSSPSYKYYLETNQDNKIDNTVLGGLREFIRSIGFFLNGFKGDVSIRYLFSFFNRDEFGGIFKCLFITNIKNILWYLLLIIPGVIKSYEYSMVHIF